MTKKVKTIALQDIVSYMREHNIQKRDEFGDVWVVTANQIDCVEQRKLNIELGVSRVNYTKEAMTRKRV